MGSTMSTLSSVHSQNTTEERILSSFDSQEEESESNTDNENNRGTQASREDETQSPCSGRLEIETSTFELTPVCAGSFKEEEQAVEVPEELPIAIFEGLLPDDDIALSDNCTADTNHLEDIDVPAQEMNIPDSVIETEETTDTGKRTRMASRRSTRSRLDLQTEEVMPIVEAVSGRKELTCRRTQGSPAANCESDSRRVSRSMRIVRFQEEEVQGNSEDLAGVTKAATVGPSNGVRKKRRKKRRTRYALTKEDLDMEITVNMNITFSDQDNSDSEKTSKKRISTIEKTNPATEDTRHFQGQVKSTRRTKPEASKGNRNRLRRRRRRVFTKKPFEYKWPAPTVNSLSKAKVTPTTENIASTSKGQKKTLICKICCKQYKFQAAMNKHIAMMHKSVDEAEADEHTAVNTYQPDVNRVSVRLFEGESQQVSVRITQEHLDFLKKSLEEQERSNQEPSDSEPGSKAQQKSSSGLTRNNRDSEVASTARNSREGSEENVHSVINKELKRLQSKKQLYARMLSNTCRVKIFDIRNIAKLFHVDRGINIQEFYAELRNRQDRGLNLIKPGAKREGNDYKVKGARRSATMINSDDINSESLNMYSGESTKNSEEMKKRGKRMATYSAFKPNERFAEVKRPRRSVRNSAVVAVNTEEGRTGEAEKPRSVGDLDFAAMNIKNFTIPLKDLGYTPRLCPICDNEFPIKDLSSHKASHTVPCHTCSEEVPLNDIASHGASHLTTKTCEICNYKAPSKINLWGHLNTHNNRKPLICTYCGNSFASVSNLRFHINAKHMKTSEYSCEYCDQKFTSFRAKSSHQLEHSGLICTYCNSTFDDKKDLQGHIKDEHCVKLPSGKYVLK